MSLILSLSPPLSLSLSIYLSIYLSISPSQSLSSLPAPGLVPAPGGVGGVAWVPPWVWAVQHADLGPLRSSRPRPHPRPHPPGPGGRLRVWKRCPEGFFCVHSHTHTHINIHTQWPLDSIWFRPPNECCSNYIELSFLYGPLHFVVHVEINKCVHIKKKNMWPYIWQTFWSISSWDTLNFYQPHTLYTSQWKYVHM